MYIQPSSSCGETGLASSDSSADVVCGERLGGIKESRDWVCEVVFVVGPGREARLRVVGGGVEDVGSLVRAGCGRGRTGGVDGLSYVEPPQQRDSQNPGRRLFFLCVLRLDGCFSDKAPFSGNAISGPWTSCHCLGSVSLRTGLVLCFFALGCLPPLCWPAASWTSNTPRRSTNVSILVRSVNGNIVVVCLFPLPCPPLPFWSDAAWSLCCQQKNAAAPSCSLSLDSTASTPSLVFRWILGIGDEGGDFARERRQGRPCSVMPLQVGAGFLRSRRGMSDSGGWGMNGIVRFISSSYSGHFQCFFWVLLIREIRRSSSGE